MLSALQLVTITIDCKTATEKRESNYNRAVHHFYNTFTPHLTVTSLSSDNSFLG